MLIFTYYYKGTKNELNFGIPQLQHSKTKMLWQVYILPFSQTLTLTGLDVPGAENRALTFELATCIVVLVMLVIPMLPETSGL